MTFKKGGEVDWKMYCNGQLLEVSRKRVASVRRGEVALEGEPTLRFDAVTGKELRPAPMLNSAIEPP